MRLGRLTSLLLTPKTANGRPMRASKWVTAAAIRSGVLGRHFRPLSV